MQKEIENQLKNHSQKLFRALATKHRDQIAGCLSFGRLLQISRGEAEEAAPESEHLQKCSWCSGRKKSLSTKRLGTLHREDLPAAACGNRGLDHIPSALLEPLGIPCSLVCEATSEGYELWLEGEVPFKLVVAFCREDEELYRLEVTEQLPEKVAPFQLLQGWTSLSFYSQPE